MEKLQKHWSENQHNSVFFELLQTGEKYPPQDWQQPPGSHHLIPVWASDAYQCSIICLFIYTHVQIQPTHWHLASGECLCTHAGEAKRPGGQQASSAQHMRPGRAPAVRPISSPRPALKHPSGSQGMSRAEQEGLLPSTATAPYQLLICLNSIRWNLATDCNYYFPLD